MSKLYVLEGPDCSGKTSLARRLCAHVHAHERQKIYIHASGDKRLHGSMEAYHSSLLEIACENMGDDGFDVVLDRWWPSEFVYGELFRPGWSKKYNMLEMLSRRVDAVYIFCAGNAAIYQDNVDPDHPYDLEHYRKICNGYARVEEIAKDLGLKVVNYSIVQHGHDLTRFIASLP